jgi:hypothetical protein
MAQHDISYDAANATVPTFVEDKKAYLHKRNSPKGGGDKDQSWKSYLYLPGEGGNNQESIILGKDRGFRFPQ